MANYTTATSDKSKKTALLLCIFAGYVGAHYYYVGRIKRGLLYTFTMGFCCFGWFADIIVILLGDFRDNVGQPLRK